METFAYLQVAQDYEDPEGKELVFLKDGLAMFKSINGLRLPSQTLFLLLGVTCSAFVLNIAGAAQAALFRGDSGPDVSNVQSLLNSNGYPVPVTGFFGTQTEGQVISFQSNNGLVADGIVGDATLNALSGFRPIAPDTGSLLRFGSSGSAVTNLQNLLNDNGYFFGPFTGYFGTSTEAAVINFQADNGLSADGVVGPSTIAALESGGFVPSRPGGSTLFPGDSGPAVSDLQNLLNSSGYSVPVTGFYGTVTEQQVRNFQYDSYLTVDGVAGSATLAALSGSGFRPVRPGDDEMANTPVYGLFDRGDGVAGIQEAMRQRGFYTGPIDGIYGYGTFDAVAAFQRANGVVPIDGIWGPRTAAASV